MAAIGWNTAGRSISASQCAHMSSCGLLLHYKAYDPMFELVGDAVVNVYENHDEKIAFLQLKEQTKHIMVVLDGIV
ncbi:hypothetical protein D5086_008025 [Populus alba]|uniref:Uncharacterized protein n=1 Tax=Populus alba TaxID=43335 RepID=A0ACC4CGQ4_POPAL